MGPWWWSHRLCCTNPAEHPDGTEGDEDDLGQVLAKPKGGMRTNSD